jgi:hypothetical protein
LKGDYKDLIETVVKREIGILGFEKTMAIAREAKINVDGDGRVMNPTAGKGDLERLMKIFYDKCGMVTILGCKIALRKLSMEYGLELPDIVK